MVWPKEKEELKFGKVLGKGFFGEVWACRFRDDTMRPQIAVKKIPLSLVRQHKLCAQMDREIQILARLDHPNIVKLLFDFRDSAHVYLGMEFAEGGGMFPRLRKLGKFPLASAAQYFYETCDALAYLHGMPEKVVHRDIKPENILFDKDFHVKLADFGWSNMMQGLDSRSTFCGTPDYLAPEMIRGAGHCESLDMWCMGVLLYEMVLGKSPFGSSSQQQTCKKILKCELRFPSDMDSFAKDCIQSLCKVVPGERLSARQALETAFVIKHYEAADERLHERPSVATRRLRHDKGILRTEMKAVLEHKSKLEEQMFERTTDIEEIYRKLHEEKARLDFVKGELARLRETEAQQTCEIEQLHAKGYEDHSTPATGRVGRLAGS